MTSSCRSNPSSNGPGYRSPLEAYKSGPRERLMFVTTVSTRKGGHDALAVIDVDPDSSRYGTIVSTLTMPHPNDELHHFGWNSCSSCFGDVSKVRDKIILPCLLSDRIYIVDTSDETRLKIVETIEGLPDQFKVTAPHTVHCLPSNEVAVSCMGDEKGDGKGTILLIDGTTFKVKGFWSEDFTPFAYDFWYQPKFGVLVTSEWGSPNAWRNGFDPREEVIGQQYGSRLHFYSWKKRILTQTIDLGSEGLLPLEVRFLHNPDSPHGFVGCALSSAIFHFYLDSDGSWKAEKVIQVEAKKVTGWLMDEMPGVITDIIISLDDKYFYFSNWIQGDVRMYDIQDVFRPILVQSICLGGSLCNDTGIKSISGGEKEDDLRQERPSVGNIKLRGGPQMLQLSLDGERLYVTNSLFSAWDGQFYPDLIEKGSLMVKLNVNLVTQSLTLDPDFIVDFGSSPEGPMLAHEMRYPGGDCTSDVWV